MRGVWYLAQREEHVLQRQTRDIVPRRSEENVQLVHDEYFPTGLESSQRGVDVLSRVVDTSHCPIRGLSHIVPSEQPRQSVYKDKPPCPAHGV